MAERRRQHRWHYRPDEIVVAVHLPPDADQPQQAHATVRQALEQHVAGQSGGLFGTRESRESPVVFRADGKPPLAFFFFPLEQGEHADVKKAVQEAQTPAALDGLRQAGMNPLGVMPHWLGSAQQGFADPKRISCGTRIGKSQFYLCHTTCRFFFSRQSTVTRPTGH